MSNKQMKAQTEKRKNQMSHVKCEYEGTNRKKRKN